MMDILMSETCWTHKKWNKIASDIKLVFYSSAVYHVDVCHITRGALSWNFNNTGYTWVAAIMLCFFQSRIMGKRKLQFVHGVHACKCIMSMQCACKRNNIHRTYYWHGTLTLWQSISLLNLALTCNWCQLCGSNLPKFIWRKLFKTTLNIKFMSSGVDVQQHKLSLPIKCVLQVIKGDDMWVTKDSGWNPQYKESLFVTVTCITFSLLSKLIVRSLGTSTTEYWPKEGDRILTHSRWLVGYTVLCRSALKAECLTANSLLFLPQTAHVEWCNIMEPVWQRWNLPSHDYYYLPSY